MSITANQAPGRHCAVALYLLFGGMFALVFVLGANAAPHLQGLLLTKADFISTIILLAGTIVAFQMIAFGIDVASEQAFDLLVLAICAFFFSAGLQEGVRGNAICGYIGLVYSITGLINLHRPHPSNRFYAWADKKLPESLRKKFKKRR